MFLDEINRLMTLEDFGRSLEFRKNFPCPESGRLEPPYKGSNSSKGPERSSFAAAGRCELGTDQPNGSGDFIIPHAGVSNGGGR